MLFLFLCLECTSGGGGRQEEKGLSRLGFVNAIKNFDKAIVFSASLHRPFSHPSSSLGIQKAVNQ